MLIEHYDLKVFTPPCDPEAERFAAFAELAVDISEVRPYLNATLLHHLLAADTPEDFNARWDFIAKHFDLLYSEPEHIAPLRQAILELAVRGKLTRQAASDEPASELLKRIQAEKARLVEAGEIRDSDPLSAIQEDEQAFELAEGWAWTRLGSVAVVGTGSTPRRDQPDYYEDGTVAWITSCATNHPFVSQADEYITEVAVRDTRLRVYPKHTLLVALYGQGKTRGQVSELLIEATINQACAAMVFEGEMSGLRQYTKTFLLKHYHELREQAAGAAQPNLNLNKPKQTVMPLPPLTEQQRIVARVEQLLGLCDALEAKLQAAQTQREKLVAAVVVGVSNPPPGLWPGGAPSGERGWG